MKGRTTLAEPVLRADAVHRSEVDAGRSEIRSGHAAGTEAKSYAGGRLVKDIRANELKNDPTGHAVYFYMRTLLLLFFIAASAVDASDDPTWEAYKKKFSKQYVSDDEEERRHTLFNSSLARADGRNKAR